MKHFSLLSNAILALSFSVLMMWHPTQAQSGQDLLKTLQFGAKAGILTSAIGGDVRTLGQANIMLGGFVSAPVWEIADLKIEALFMGMGAVDASRRDVNGRWNYTYLSLPLVASFIVFNNTDIRLEAGLQPGFLLDAWYVDRQRRYDILSETRKLDVGLIVGGAWHFYPHWMLDLRVVASLHNHSLRTWTGDQYVNQALQIGVGYLFGEK